MKRTGIILFIIIDTACTYALHVQCGTCPLDSVLRFDIDSVLVEVTAYEYGDTTRTTVWTVNPDASRIGKSRQESASNTSGTFSASYGWDETTNDWKGNSKTEVLYTASQKIASNTNYIWFNRAWVADTRYAFTYDDAGRETEYWTLVRDKTTNELVPSKVRYRTWSVGAQVTEEINYTAWSGGNWTAGDKKEYTYNAKGKETACMKSSFANGVWTLTNEDYTDYDASGNITLIERYAYKNGIRSGTGKTAYFFNAEGKEIAYIQYKWLNGEWVYKLWNVTETDANGHVVETAAYSWENDAWTGSGKRVLRTYTGKYETEYITQNWPAGATAWVNVSRIETAYEGSLKTRTASYTWQNDAWLGTNRTDWHYTSSGMNDTTVTYTHDGTDWIPSERTASLFDERGNTVLEHHAVWNGTGWQLNFMTRNELVYENERQLLKATWKCNADSVWVGITKDTTAYSLSGLQIYTAHYTYSTDSKDWTPSSKTETAYDDRDHQISQQSYIWDEASGIWMGRSRTDKTYYRSDKVATLTQFGWDTTNDTWLPSKRFAYVYDQEGKETEQVVEYYTDGAWVRANRYEKEYAGNTLIKNNTYTWRNNEWMLTVRNEAYYDDDAEYKLRREISGAWNNKGELSSYLDLHYFYACDAEQTPADMEDVQGNKVQVTKTIENGVLYLMYNGRRYDVQGRRVK